jgi:hypothetical protein
MEKEPKSVWTKPWKGRRAFLFWILIVPVAAFLGACVIAAITSISVPLFGRQSGFRSFAGSALVITFLLLIGIAALLGVWSFVSWAFQPRNFKRFLFGVACFATLIALFYAEEDWRGKSEWQKFKRQWEAKGENFDRASVVPQPVPDDQNFAMSPVWIAALKYSYEKSAKAWYGDRIYDDEVSNYFQLLPMSVSAVVGTNWAWRLPEPSGKWGNWNVAHMTDLRPWQSFYRNLEQTNPSADIVFPPGTQTPAQDVLTALSKYDPLIERLRQDSRLPDSRFPIQYDVDVGDQNPGAILLPHLSTIKPFAQVLELRAIAELQNGESEKALADINLMFRLLDANRTEPFLISHLVRLAILQIALQPIYEGLANHQWSDSQLAELDSKLSNVDFVDDYKFSLRGEMVFFQVGILDYLRRHPEQIGNVYSDTASSPPFMVRVVTDLIPGGWYYQNVLHSAQAMEEHYLPDVDTNREILSPSLFRAADTTVQADTRHANPYNILEKMLLPTFSAATLRFAYGQNAANLARVAIALERYRMAHGKYPDSLDPLEPQFITQLPHDIINGQPLHYQRTANGQFILYSVGWNENDDGGAVVMKKGETPGVDYKKGDWVWRYPEK